MTSLVLLTTIIDAVTLTKRQNLKELERRAIVITVARGHVRVKRDSPVPCVAEFVEPALRTKDIAVDHGKSHEL
jgi:ribosome maturation protein Sdo1